MALYAASFSPIVQTVKVLPDKDSSENNFRTKGALTCFAEEVRNKPRYGHHKKINIYRKVLFDGDKTDPEQFKTINAVYPLSEGTFFPAGEPTDAAFTVSDHADVVFTDNATIEACGMVDKNIVNDSEYKTSMSDTIPCGSSLHCLVHRHENAGKHTLLLIPLPNYTDNHMAWNSSPDSKVIYIGITKQPHFRDDPYWTVHMN
jgi:hypothetical protein